MLMTIFCPLNRAMSKKAHQSGLSSARGTPNCPSNLPSTVRLILRLGARLLMGIFR